MEDITSDFVYLRLHGAVEIYTSGYDDSALNWWAQRLRLWQSGREPRDRRCVTRQKVKRQSRDVYVYFDNDVKVRAPVDAIHLYERLVESS